MTRDSSCSTICNSVAGLIGRAALLIASLLVSECSADDAATVADKLQMASFQCDITPPVNEPIGLGFIPLPHTVEHPLLAKGVVLKDAGGIYVLCAIDWMEVHNDSYDFLREQIALAAGTTISRVAVHCLHQHTAPAIDSTAQRIQLAEDDPRRDPEFMEAANRELLADPNATFIVHLKAAFNLAWIERAKAGHLVELSCLTIGNLQLLNLPGEPFVQYQLAAQQMRPESFVLVAGYGDCGMSYIGGDRIYADRGGYEQTYAFSGPCEQLLLATMKQLLEGK